MAKHKNDIILIALVLSAALLIWLGLVLFRESGEYVLVSRDGAELARYPLDTDLQVELSDNGGYNTLIIHDGTAHISDASCPDKLCVNQGSIEFSGQSIICLPNRLVVEIKGGEVSEIDGVAK